MKRNSFLAMSAGALSGYLLAKRLKDDALPASSHGAHVVILGAGFGGLAAARQLSSFGKQIRITVVDRHNYHLFTPLLYQAATCGIVPYDAALPVRQWTGRHHLQFEQADVQGIDLSTRTVHLDTGRLGYDYLVIALGSTTNFFGNASASQHALPLKTMEDGITIRNHIIDTLERAAGKSDAQQRRELMTYVVVGGGATGVETAGAIAGLLRLVIPTDYPSLRAVEWKVVILEAGPKLLGHMSHEMARLALAEMKNAGVEIRLNTRAASVTGDQVATDSGEILRTRSVIWAAGVRVPDVISAMPTKHGHHGSIVVDEYLRISGDSHAYAIGDNAHFVNPQTGKPVPLLAATAMQQGETTGANIVRTLRNKPLRSFRYRNLGNVVSVGRRSGVAEIGGRVIGGFAGWVAWRVVHVARLTSMRNQLATALDWTVGYFYDVDTARLDLTAKRAA